VQRRSRCAKLQAIPGTDRPTSSTWKAPTTCRPPATSTPRSSVPAPARMAECERGLLEAIEPVSVAVHAWCILPNHYHLIVEVRSVKAVVAAIGKFHGRTSFEWNGQDGARGRRVWHRCPDRLLRSEGHFWAAMNYVHHNPVRHGYVERWEKWPFSSARRFLAEVGRAEAARLWRAYPLLDFGKGWDEPGM